MKRNILPLVLAALSLTSISLGIMLAVEEPQETTNEVDVDTLSESDVDFASI